MVERVYQENKKIKKGSIEEKKELAKDNSEIIEKCIDVRLFGQVFSHQNFIGPVQMDYAQSLHKVEVVPQKGTAIFASSDTKDKGTFRYDMILPYAAFDYFGSVNDANAKILNLQEEEVQLFLQALWKSYTLNPTRNKSNYRPLYLCYVNSLGLNTSYDLKDFITLNLNDDIVDEKDIRSINDYSLDFTKASNYLRELLEKNKIEKPLFVKTSNLNIEGLDESVFNIVEEIDFV